MKLKGCLCTWATLKNFWKVVSSASWAGWAWAWAGVDIEVENVGERIGVTAGHRYATHIMERRTGAVCRSGRRQKNFKTPTHYSLQPLATHTRAPEISHSCWYSSTCSHSQGSSYSLWKTLPKSNASGDIEHEVRISKLPYIKTHSNNLRASAIASKHLQLANIRM